MKTIKVACRINQWTPLPNRLKIVADINLVHT